MSVAPRETPSPASNLDQGALVMSEIAPAITTSGTTDGRTVPPAAHPAVAGRRRGLFRLAALSRRAANPAGVKRSPWATQAALMLAGQIAVGLMVAVTTFLLVMHLRDHAMHEAEQEQRRLSLILADQAERAFEAVELVQTALVKRLSHDGVTTPEAFRLAMSETFMHDELSGHGHMLPQLDAITIVDADGNLINSSRPILGPAVNVADRDYFLALKADPARTTFFSEPLRNRSNGKTTAYLARKVAGPDGALLGLILGSLKLDYFEELYRSLALGAESSIGLRREDGILLAHFPHLALEKARAMRDSGLLQSPVPASPNAIVFRKVGPIDGKERLIADRALVHFPAIVAVTNEVAAILAEWRQQVAILVTGAVILECMLAGLGVLMLRRLRGDRLLSEARAARSEAEAARHQMEAELAVARERERADRELCSQNVRFEAAFSNMSQALFMFDAEDRLMVVNGRAAEMFGLPASSFSTGITFAATRALLAAASNLGPTDIKAMFESIERLKAIGQRTSHLRELADGRTLSVNFAPIESDGWLVTLEDTTRRRQAEARIAYMAHHDALTGLPNRVLFHTRLREAIARGRRGEPCAVLYLDLDHFKDVNDTLGHPIGDALLRAVTSRLAAEVRETDTMARLGGDEFAIVQSSVDQPRDATALAARLIELFKTPFDVNGHQVMTATSVGIALVPEDGEDADRIMKNADLALYCAKADGRGRFRFFEPEMDALMQTRRAMELDMRKALQAGEFELFYQPLMNIKTGSIAGFEALVRWRHPKRGLVQPDDFIPLAEEIGLIVPLGAWALRRACQDAVSWPGDIKVAVNVSVIQFGGGTLLEDVAAALRETGLHPSRLELEITESVMLNDTETTLVILYQLRDLGVGIAMDDFGTGYSSLSYLRRFPFSKVKIDRSFIADLGKDGGSDAIVTAVTELCETLGMLTLAEGVETEEQLTQLRAGNCGEAQGYLFSTPRPASEVQAMCLRLNRAVPAEAAA
jgi:diguanylate cyclase (GGDEF)-like protein